MVTSLFSRNLSSLLAFSFHLDFDWRTLVNELVDGGWREETFSQLMGRNCKHLESTGYLYVEIRFPCGMVNHGISCICSIHSLRLVELLLVY